MSPASVACTDSVGELARSAAPGARLDSLGQTKIEHLHGSIRTKFDVRGFEIAMNDAVIVRGLKRFRDLPRDRQRFVDWYRPARDPLREVLAFDQLHYDRRILDTVDVRDVRMIERCQHLRLSAETGKAVRIVGDCGQQHLDRNVAIQFRVARAIHLAHSARAEGGQDFVAAEARAGMKGHGISGRADRAAPRGRDGDATRVLSARLPASRFGAPRAAGS